MKADKLAKEAPELVQKVARGELSLPAAIKQIEPEKPAKAHEAANDEPDEQDEVEALREMLAETASQLDAANAELERLRRIIEADDQLAEMQKIIDQKDALIAGLKEQLNGIMNEKAEAIRLVKRLQRKQGVAA